MKSSTQVKVKPPQSIIPCPRCINGQILTINRWVCFQCGYEDTFRLELEEYSRKVTEEAQPLQNYPLFRVAERIICPKCGKEVCLSNNIEVKVIRVHKDPKTDGAFPRPWCEMSGEVIP